MVVTAGKSRDLFASQLPSIIISETHMGTFFFFFSAFTSIQQSHEQRHLEMAFERELGGTMGFFYTVAIRETDMVGGKLLRRESARVMVSEWYN